MLDQATHPTIDKLLHDADDFRERIETERAMLPAVNLPQVAKLGAATSTSLLRQAL